MCYLQDRLSNEIQRMPGYSGYNFNNSVKQFQSNTVRNTHLSNNINNISSINNVNNNINCKTTQQRTSDTESSQSHF